MLLLLYGTRDYLSGALGAELCAPAGPRRCGWSRAALRVYACQTHIPAHVQGHTYVMRSNSQYFCANRQCAAVHTGSHAQQCVTCGWWVVWGPEFAVSSSALPCTWDDVHCAASSTTHAAGGVLVCSENAGAAARPAGVAAKPDLH